MEKFVPKSARGAEVKYFAVSAHKDDVEMLALDGIFKCRDTGGFAAAVLTDGGQCPRSAEYAAVSDEDMALLRAAEQKRAAEAGRYEELYLFENPPQRSSGRRRKAGTPCWDWRKFSVPIRASKRFISTILSTGIPPTSPLSKRR